MSRNWPIWNAVTNCNYNSDKSYGNKDTGDVRILVGSSSKNSHELVKHTTTRREETYEGQPAIVFRFGVDGVVLKTMIFSNKNGRAEELLKTINALDEATKTQPS